MDCLVAGIDDSADTLFMDGVGKRPQQRHRNGLDLLLVDEVTDGLGNLSLIQFLNNGALVIHPLRHAADQFVRNQRSRAVRGNRVFKSLFRQARPAPVSAPGDQQGVFETRRGNQAGAGALALQQGIVNDGGTVDEQGGPLEDIFNIRPHHGGGRTDGVNDAIGKIRRSRQGLTDKDGAAVFNDHRIGTGAAYVSCNNERHFEPLITGLPAFLKSLPMHENFYTE